MTSAAASTPRTLEDSRRWMRDGTALVAMALDGLDGQGFAAPTELPGWTRKHLLAHVAANADAIGNLVRWAATGEPTPMYASPEQRRADIEAGAERSVADLMAWFSSSADALAAGMEALAPEQWQAEVVTRHGRPVPASETPWMRSREVMVHAVDLGTSVTFADLPADFLVALTDDIVAARNEAHHSEYGPPLAIQASDHDRSWSLEGDGASVHVIGTLAGITAYLAGRGSRAVTTAAGTAAPGLPDWL